MAVVLDGEPLPLPVDVLVFSPVPEQLQVFINGRRPKSVRIGIVKKMRPNVNIHHYAAGNGAGNRINKIEKYLVKGEEFLTANCTSTDAPVL